MNLLRSPDRLIPTVRELRRSNRVSLPGGRMMVDNSYIILSLGWEKPLKPKHVKHLAMDIVTDNRFAGFVAATG